MVVLVPLQEETRSALPTDEAAAHLGLAQQTLRRWSCFQTGPLRPVRIGNRLRWPTAEIKKLLGV